MPCRRLRNELDELPDEDACIGLTPRLDEELREDEEPVRPEEGLEVGDVLELLEEGLELVDFRLQRRGVRISTA